MCTLSNQNVFDLVFIRTKTYSDIRASKIFQMKIPLVTTAGKSSDHFKRNKVVQSRR